MRPAPELFPYVLVPAAPKGGNLVAEMPGDIYDRVVTRIAISGPAGSIFELYNNLYSPANLLDRTRQGQTNTAEYPNPISVPRGSTLLGVWPNATGAATVTFYQERR